MGELKVSKSLNYVTSQLEQWLCSNCYFCCYCWRINIYHTPRETHLSHDRLVAFAQKQRNRRAIIRLEFGSEFKLKFRYRYRYSFVDVLIFVLVPRFIKSGNFLMLMLINARWTDRYEWTTGKERRKQQEDKTTTLTLARSHSRLHNMPTLSCPVPCYPISCLGAYFEHLIYI